MAHIIVIFISPSNHCITKIIEKWGNFHVPSPLSPSRLIGRREMINSSGLECEVCVVHFK